MIVEEPSSRSETSFETEYSSDPSEPQTMEDLGNPPPNDRPHDNPLY